MFQTTNQISNHEMCFLKPSNLTLISMICYWYAPCISKWPPSVALSNFRPIPMLCPETLLSSAHLSALSSPSKFDSYVMVTQSCPCTVMGCPHLEHSGTTRIYACPFSCTKKTRVMNSNDIFNKALQGWISQTCWALFQLQMPGAKRHLIAWCHFNQLQRKNAP